MKLKFILILDSFFLSGFLFSFFSFVEHWNCWLSRWKSDLLGLLRPYDLMLMTHVRTNCKQILESRRMMYFNYSFFISLQLLRHLPAIFGRDRFPSRLASPRIALNYHHVRVLALPSYTSYIFSLCATLNL